MTAPAARNVRQYTAKNINGVRQDSDATSNGFTTDNFGHVCNACGYRVPSNVARGPYSWGWLRYVQEHYAAGCMVTWVWPHDPGEPNDGQALVLTEMERFTLIMEQFSVIHQRLDEIEERL